MIKQIKAFTINLIAGANIATVLLMLASGYADHIHPAEHQMLSNMGMLFPFFLFANLLFIFFWLTFKWKKVWIPILGYALAFPPICTYMPLHTAQEVPEGTLKIISYNVCQYGGNWKYEQGFDTIYNYLKRLQPDIVCLQEDAPRRAANSIRFEELYPYNDTVHVNRPGSPYMAFVRAAAEDAWDRLLFPSLEREIRAELTDRANAAAINEAVELAKGYDEPDTVAFVNGVLGGYMRGRSET